MPTYTGHWQAVDARGDEHAGEISVRAPGMGLAVLHATARIADQLETDRQGDLIELTVTLAREGA